MRKQKVISFEINGSARSSKTLTVIFHASLKSFMFIFCGNYEAAGGAASKTFLIDNLSLNC